ncbi:unnamed protein product [Dracunculus medinensis]|uniref:Reverse transcriptase n=1 Tax=Dracunculus medinensis TaxID=318479 RepID=A0A0N4ULL2_DRAME|nr:unnamed protein product [Dracunculus medinensis]
MDTACRHSKSVQIQSRASYLEYLDVVLFANSHDEMQVMLNKCQQLQQELDSGASSSLVGERSPSSTIGVDAYFVTCNGWCQKRGRPVKNWADTSEKNFERIDGPSI